VVTSEYAVRAGIAFTGRPLRVERDRCYWVRNGQVESVESTASCPLTHLGSENTILTPTVGLGHTHSMDHAFPEYGVDRPLEELVAPPRGLKHRLLEGLSWKEAVEATLQYYRLAWRNGASLILDFRERGGFGCLTAKKALSTAPEGLKAIILGRPGEDWPLGCDGLGLNSPLDYNIGTVRELASQYRPSAAHVAETVDARRSGDLEAALEAGLDFIVHGTFLSCDDIGLLEEKGVGLVLCPSSNMWHSTGLPPVGCALSRLSRVSLGTDNAAWHGPDAWREASLALHVARLQGYRAPSIARRIAEALFYGAYEIVGLEPPVPVEGGPATFLLWSGHDSRISESMEPFGGLVKRSGLLRLIARIDGGRISWV